MVRGDQVKVRPVNPEELPWVKGQAPKLVPVKPEELPWAKGQAPKLVPVRPEELPWAKPEAVQPRVEGFLPGLVHGAKSVVEMGKGALALAGITKPVEPAPSPRRIEITDVRNVGDLLSLITTTIGEQLPITGATVAPAIAGSKLGAAAGAAVGGPVGAGVGAAIGGVLGLGLGALGLNAGETYLNLRAKGVPHEAAARTALPVGGLKSLLDVVTPLRVMGRVMFFPRKVLQDIAERKAASSLVKDVAKGALAGQVTEVPTEVAQELADVAAERMHKLPTSADEVIARVLNAGVTAAIAGGIYGAAGAVGERLAAGRPEAPPTPPQLQPERQMNLFEAATARERSDRLGLPAAVVDTGATATSAELDELTIKSAPLLGAIKEALPEGQEVPHLAVGPKVAVELEDESGVRKLLHVDNIKPEGIAQSVAQFIENEYGVKPTEKGLEALKRPELIPVVRALQAESDRRVQALGSAHELVSRLLHLARSGPARKSVLELVHTMGYEAVQLPRTQVEGIEVFQVGEGFPRPVSRQSFEDQFSSLPKGLAAWVKGVEAVTRSVLDIVAQADPALFGDLPSQFRGVRIGVGWSDPSVAMRFDPMLDEQGGFSIALGPSAGVPPQYLISVIAHELAHSVAIPHKSEGFVAAVTSAMRAINPHRKELEAQAIEALRAFAAERGSPDEKAAVKDLSLVVRELTYDKPRDLAQTGVLKHVSHYKRLRDQARVEKPFSTQWDVLYGAYLARQVQSGREVGLIDTTNLLSEDELAEFEGKLSDLLRAYERFWVDTSPEKDLPPPPLQVGLSATTEIDTSYGTVPLVRLNPVISAAGQFASKLTREGHLRASLMLSDLATLYGAPHWRFVSYYKASYDELVKAIQNAEPVLEDLVIRYFDNLAKVAVAGQPTGWWKAYTSFAKTSADLVREITDAYYQTATMGHLLRYPSPSGKYYLLAPPIEGAEVTWGAAFEQFTWPGMPSAFLAKPKEESIEKAFSALKYTDRIMDIIHKYANRWVHKVPGSAGPVPGVRIAINPSRSAISKELMAFFMSIGLHDEPVVVFTGENLFYMPYMEPEAEKWLTHLPSETHEIWAAGVVHLLRHELTHLVYLGHRRDFLSALSRLTRHTMSEGFAMMEELVQVIEQASNELVEDPKDVIEYYLLREIQDARDALSYSTVSRKQALVEYKEAISNVIARVRDRLRAYAPGLPSGAGPVREATVPSRPAPKAKRQGRGPAGTGGLTKGKGAEAGPTARGAPSGMERIGSRLEVGGFTPGSWPEPPTDKPYFSLPHTPEPEPSSPELEAAVGAEALPPNVAQEVRPAVARFGKWAPYVLHILQWADRNPHIEPLQRYVEIARAKWLPYKASVLKVAADRLSEWTSLGVRRANILSEMLLQATERSERAKRPLTPEEIGALARELKADEEVVGMFHKVLGDLRWVLDTMEEELVAESDRLGGDIVDRYLRETQIRAEFARLRNRTYFPMARFGRFMVVVKATRGIEHGGVRFKPGATVEVTAWETERDAKRYRDEVLRELGADNVTAKVSMAQDAVYDFVGFPPSLYRQLVARLNLDESQKALLRDVMYRYAPGRGFVKHLRRRRGIRGFSRDAQRAYASYMRAASNHLPRLKYRWELEEAISGTQRLARGEPINSTSYDRLVGALRKHYEYLMNPGEEYAALRGGIFLWFFGYNPKQILVNLSQLPLFAYPYLASIYGDAPTLREMAKAIRQVARPSKYAEALRDVEDLLNRALQEGFINESYATEVSAYAERQLLQRAVPSGPRDAVLRPLIHYAVEGFRLSEEFMRRVVFIAAVRLARARGASDAEAYHSARKAVDDTMFEYSRLARPAIMRGRAAPLFIFRLFLQNALYYTFTGKEGQFSLKSKGGWRYWLGLALLGGIAGVPFAKNIADLLKLLITKSKELFGSKDPHTDLLLETRQLLGELGLNPDFLVDGLAKYSFGLVALENLFGAPVPALSTATSVQMGYILPTEPIVKGLLGERDWKEALFDFIVETTGATAAVGTTAAKALMLQGPDALYTLRVAMPSVVRNLARAGEYLVTGTATDSRGNVVLKFDLSNPGHVAEIVGQALGFQPTRLVVESERRAVLNDITRYYIGRRSAILAAYTRALALREKEGIADARREIVEFNRTAPPPFRITQRDLAEALRSRLKHAHLRLRGYPLTRDLVPISKELQKAYPPVSYQSQPTAR